ncbi:fasciclin domain-containing protein [Streptosporangium sp. CA-135522]|uniref:fasciclin domain-containing protein n=1 Tax=Streptosporangium sp. CA-135522 TaxID=3240072 RepID=UPI003D8A1B89
MKKKSLLASALTVLALTAVPVAAQATATSPVLRVSPTPMPTDMTSESPTDMMSESPGAMTKPFGPGCSSLPTTGEGSPENMAKEPVATAATYNPQLSVLVEAIKKAGLVDTLNSAKALTVFAPTNEAFSKISKDMLGKVLADKSQLTKLLTYHVVEGRKTPMELSEGSLTTLSGGTLTVKGSGEDYMVNGEAKVLCGNIQTANATVYLIDSVLMPQEEGASPSVEPSPS